MQITKWVQATDSKSQLQLHYAGFTYSTVRLCKIIRYPVKLEEHLGKNDHCSVQLAEMWHYCVTWWKWHENNNDDNIEYVDSIHLHTNCYMSALHLMLQNVETGLVCWRWRRQLPRTNKDFLAKFVQYDTVKCWDCVSYGRAYSELVTQRTRHLKWNSEVLRVSLVTYGSLDCIRFIYHLCCLFLFCLLPYS